MTKSDLIRSAMEKNIADQDAIRSAVLAAGQPGKRSSPGRFAARMIRCCAGAAAAAALFFFLIYPGLSPRTGSAPDRTLGGAAGTAGASPIGITVLAEGKETKLAPDVQIGLGSYALTMSSTPGFPLRCSTTLGPTVRVEATCGALLLWDRSSGKITQVGSSTVIPSGSTVYWSPLGAHGSLCETAAVTFSVGEGDAKKSAEIDFTSSGAVYTACLAGNSK